MSLGVIASHYVAAGGGGGGSAAAFVSQASGAATATATKPAGLAVGDHLFIVCVDNYTTITSTGFTQWIQDGNIQGTNYGHVLYRQIDGTEGSTFTLVGPGGSTPSTNYIAIAYRGGAGLPALIGGVPSLAGTSAVSRVRAPVDGTVIHVYCATVPTSSVTITPPVGVTSRATVAASSFWAANVSDEAMTAGTDNTRTATVTSGTSATFAFMIPTTAAIPSVVGRAWKSAASTNANIVIPSTAQVGDLFLCGFEVTAASITSGPTGFTAIDGPGVASGGTYSCNYWWGYKILASGDPGSTISCVSANQIWGASGLVIRNPQASPILATGTRTNGTGSVQSTVAVAASAGAIAVSLAMNSNSGSETAATIDTATIKGFTWGFAGAVNNGTGGYGSVNLGIHSVPSGGSSLAPSVTHGGSPTWIANTVLLRCP